MRILVLSNIPPESIGGAEIQALHLARRWAAAGHQVMLAGPANRPSAVGNLLVIRVPTLKLTKALRGLSYLVATLWLLWRHRRNYDVIYCRFLKEQAFAANLAKFFFRLRQPLVACPESSASSGDAAYIAQLPMKSIWIRLFRSTLTAINAISQRIEREILDLGLGNIHITRIPNGVALPEIGSAQPTDNTILRVLFVGRLVEAKGLDLLLDATRLLRDSGRIFELRLVGYGPLQSEIEDRVRELSLHDCVHFAGKLPPDKIATEFNNANLFVLPSRYEGMPGALLEAIGHGLPAVATRVSGSEEIIDDTIGWLVPVGDVGELARAIGQALDLGRKSLREMGQRARAKAARDYDIDQVAKRYEYLFEELVADTTNAAR